MENQNQQNQKSAKEKSQEQPSSPLNPRRWSKGLTSDAEAEVRENEGASLQDDSYSFDEDNTDNDEYHDTGGEDLEDMDLDNDDDFIY